MQTEKARTRKLQLDSIGIWRRGHAYYTLEETLPTFCPWLETLQRTEIKGDSLITLAENMSR